MARWEPGTRERLHAAALELFATRGYEQTTAAEIAETVGLTERTFFRHFADKREVLFDGQHLLLDALLAGVRAAPPEAAPLAVVAAALDAAAAFFDEDRRPFSRTRQAVIDRNPALQERERNKLVALSDALAAALRERGIGDPAATLAARCGLAVFEIAFTAWIAEGEDRPMAELQSAVLAELAALTREGQRV